MIVILKQNAEQNEVNALLKQLEEMGFDHHYSKGENSAIVGIIGDTSTLDTDDLKTIDVVADVREFPSRSSLQTASSTRIIVFSTLPAEQ